MKQRDRNRSDVSEVTRECSYNKQEGKMGEAEKALEVFVLVDRTGSMASRWDETLSAVNGYVEKVGKDTPDTKFTVAVFDLQDGLQFDVVRDAVTLPNWKGLTDADATPRGMTPLYDAIQRMIAKVEASNPDKAVVVVITDGEENSSRETTKEQAKASIDRCKGKNWQVVFLGADFDAFDQAHMVGVDRGQTMTSTTGHYDKAMRATAVNTSSYASSGASMSYSPKQRKEAVGEEK